MVLPKSDRLVCDGKHIASADTHVGVSADVFMYVHVYMSKR